MKSLSDFLHAHGLERYLAAFEHNDIDLEVVRLLNEPDLEKLGVSLGHRKRLLSAIAELQRAQAGLTGRAASPQPSMARTLTTDGERRQLTVLFCDLVASTELSSRMDPEAWRDVIRGYDDLCSRATARFEGFVFQRQGDGIVSYFGYPQAHEDAPERAIRAGLKILEGMPQIQLPGAGKLRVRIGVSTGLVVVSDIRAEDKSAVGETMNLAARLQAVAEPDTMVISGSTRRLVGGGFEFEDLGAHVLKGIAEPVPVWRVVGVSQAEGRFDAATRSGLSPLVGREREIAILLGRWEKVERGEGQAVLLSGEPGIGKSRILHALREKLGSRAGMVMRFQCSPFFTNSAFHPIIENLERELRFAEDETTEAKLDRLEKMMVGHNARPLRDVALVASVLSLPIAARYDPLGMTPQRQKEETIRALVELSGAIASRQLTLTLFEDLHWADPTTLQVLDLLIERLARFPMLLLITYRPELRPKWESHTHVKMLSITRLGRAQSAALATGLADTALPDELLDEIVAKTDGVPLYLEELTKAVLESHALGQAGDPGTMARVSIPATLRDSLMARLDRLLPVKGVAQLGSVLGREFSYEMLSAVALMPKPELEHALERLTHSGLVVRRGVPPQATYAFKHALIQDAAYESLLKSSRQQMHKTIAGVFEERFPAIRDSKPELLAHHYTEAGLREKAVTYWYRAGKNAVERSANIEAIRQLGKGLAVLKALPVRPENDQLELQLQTLLGNALMAMKGYGAPEVGQTFDRARELCERLGETPQLFPVLRGLWMFYLVRSEVAAASELADQLLQLAERVGEPSLLLEAHRAKGMTCFFSGEFALARSHLDRGIALYDPEQHRAHAFLYGTDPGVACLCYVAASLWLLGLPEQAIARLDDGLRLAEQCGHAFTRSFALFFSAMLRQYRRETTLARKEAESAVALAKDEGFVLWLAMAMIVHGWTGVEQGRNEEGLAEMRQGLVTYQATGAGLARTYILSLLAEACDKSGRSGEALAVLTEALEARQRSGERVFEAELHRLKGEFALQVAQGKRAQFAAAEESGGVPEGALVEAEACFGQALAIARSQGAKAFELRAAMGLGRIWRAQGKPDDARRLLAEIYGSFIEGLDTPDLKDARQLLGELD